MTRIAGIDWDDAFDNSGYVEKAEGYRDIWATDAESFRELFRSEGRASFDQRYGLAPREVYDLFQPGGQPKGTVVFVHGGYWHLLDKSYWSHYAKGPLAMGWAVAMPSYPLAPQARISQITDAIQRAVSQIAENTKGPIALVGHSAGGHLVSRMLCEGIMPISVIRRIQRVVSVSGVHHLEPLLLTRMNETLKLDAEEAFRESPVYSAPVASADITFFVGDQERPEFLRQTRMIAEIWGRKGGSVRTVYDLGTHHFNVLESLKDPKGTLTYEVLK